METSEAVLVQNAREIVRRARRTTRHQDGYIWLERRVWFGRWREDVIQSDGTLKRVQRAKKLADYGDRYRCESDVRPLLNEELARVVTAATHPRSSELFADYVEKVYLPHVERTNKPSTYHGYKTYWTLYVKPHVAGYALRDFTIAIVSSVLAEIGRAHPLNYDSLCKVRSLLSAIFTHALQHGDYPGRSAADNPASLAAIPDFASPAQTTAIASRVDVKGMLAALADHPLERSAVALAAFTGVRPGELRGLAWEDWDRNAQHITVRRSVWHGIEGTPKTQNSVRHVAVTGELRGILLALWNSQGSPISGYILTHPACKNHAKDGKRANLDNLSKRTIAPVLAKAGIEWHGFYSLRRFYGTQVREFSGSSDTASKALGNTKEVADKHYIKPAAVLPDVRRAVRRISQGLL